VTERHEDDDTPLPEVGGRSGRFWHRAWQSTRFRWMVGLSLAAHSLLTPWRILPTTSLEYRDVDGELEILAGVFDEAPPAPEPEPTPPAPAPAEPTSADGFLDAGRAPRDAAVDAAALDATPNDASTTDAGSNDASAADAEASGDAALADAGLFASQAPKGADELLGTSAGVATADQYTMVMLDVAELRADPLGTRVPVFLSAIPEWEKFTAGLDIDPIRDADWLVVYGPSLRRTGRNVIVVRTRMTDQALDTAIAGVSGRYPNGGPIDAGVKGMKATLGYANFAERVFLHPQPKLLVVVPPDKTTEAAQAFRKASFPNKLRPGEIARVHVKLPSKPFPFIPTTVSEARMWLATLGDEGFLIRAEGECGTAEEAQAAAPVIRDVIARENSLAVRLVTLGLLDGAKVDARDKHVQFEVRATREQAEAIMGFLAGLVGVTWPAPPPVLPKIVAPARGR
jgi:hypothetical protein